MIYDNLSFVIQGILDQRTAALAASIVQHFPGAEIVQSTNVAGSSPQGPYDHFVVVNDPEVLDGENNRNLNRLIRTSYDGVFKANNPVVCKLRSDLLFTNNTLYHSWYNWLELYQKQFHNELRIFNCPVATLNYYTIDPSAPHPFCLPFHPSDWLMMGQRNEILEYFNIPLKRGDQVYDTEGRLTNRIEQYPALCNLRKHGFSVPLGFDLDIKHVDITDAYRFLVNNFIVFDMYDTGLQSQKYQMNPNMEYLFNNRKWQETSNWLHSICE